MALNKVILSAGSRKILISVRRNPERRFAGSRLLVIGLLPIRKQAREKRTSSNVRHGDRQPNLSAGISRKGAQSRLTAVSGTTTTPIITA